MWVGLILMCLEPNGDDCRVFSGRYPDEQSCVVGMEIQKPLLEQRFSMASVHDSKCFELKRKPNV